MLHLTVPGLGHARSGLSPAPLKMPALERLLARGRRGVGPRSHAQALFEVFRIPRHARATAPFSWLGLFGEPASGWVMHADPVHYRPDRDRLLLLPFLQGSIREEEAEEFARAFNDHFEGVRLHVAGGGHWFLVLSEEPNARFTPLEQAVGQALEEAMPAGAEAGRWRRLLNEVQMLFFQLPVNQAREGRGELTVNGLWFSGPGCDPGSVGVAPGVLSAGDDPLLQGLLRAAHGEDPEERLLCFPWLEAALRQQDLQALTTALQRLDTLVAEQMRSEAEFLLHDCEGWSWHWRLAMKWHFWRR
jgi:hypothetical protein